MAAQDLNRFHNLNKNNEPVSVCDFEIFQYLKESENLFIFGGIPYIYESGVYRADLTGAKLKSRIQGLIYKKFLTASKVEQVYKLFFQDPALQKSAEDLNNFPARWINFRNAFYDPASGLLIPHSPEYISLNQIPHEYDPRRKPEYDPFIDEWLQFIAPDPEDRKMLLQYIGYCMTTDARQQKFMIVCGSGGTGKSTLLSLIGDLIGAENMSSVSLKQLEHRFAAADLMGKLLNCCADIEIGALEDTSGIKKLIGEDQIRTERKGKDAFIFRSYAKLIFSTNELPTILTEKTNGFYRRLLILDMDRKPEKTDPYFSERLAKGKSFLLWCAVNALREMYAAGTITQSAGSAERVRRVWRESDTVRAWIDEEMETEEAARLDRVTAYGWYAHYCQENDREPLKRSGFYKSLRAKGFTPDFKSGGVRYVLGLQGKAPE